MPEPIASFTGLKAWQEAHRLVLAIYKTTIQFPKYELFGLASQMQRCAVSISSNIAEGFSRKTRDDKKHFYTIALGSLTELQNQLLVARDVEHFTGEDFVPLAEQTVVVSRLIWGLMKTASTRADTKY